MTARDIARRLERLEIISHPQDSGVIVCDDADYARLYAEHPGSIFLIDDIPRSSA